jgi:hypothetical protein
VDFANCVSHRVVESTKLDCESLRFAFSFVVLRVPFSSTQLSLLRGISLSKGEAGKPLKRRGRSATSTCEVDFGEFGYAMDNSFLRALPI